MAEPVRYSPKSLEDLDELWGYVAMHLGSHSDADNLVARVMGRIERMSSYPLLGTPLSAICDTKAGYRFVTEGDWMVFYHLAEGAMYVDRVLYGRSDYLRQLLGD